MRWARRPEDLWEAALDLAAVAVVAADVWSELRDEPDVRHLGLVAAASVVAALRRRGPVTATALLLAGAVGSALLGASPLTLAVLAQVSLFSTAVRRGRRTTLALGAVVASLLTVVFTLPDDGPVHLGPVLVVLPWTGLAVGAGIAVRANRDYVRALEERAAATHAARESETERRVADERLRIARDLHDAVAHTIAVVNVHAGAAERHLRTDADRAEASLHEVRSASRRVLRELRDIVAVLRSGDEPGDEMGPPASAEGIPSLLTGARHLGMDVRADVRTAFAGLDGTVDAALYRVLQEALTNAHRHGAGTVTVRIDDREHGLALHVSNPVAEPRPDPTGGHGLIGMRERVALAGGHLETRSPTGAFAVHAWLPRTRARSLDGGHLGQDAS